MATASDDKANDFESENDVYNILETLRYSKNLAEKRIKIVEYAEKKMAQLLIDEIGITTDAILQYLEV